MASEIYQDKTKERLELAIENKNENLEIVNNKINTLEEKISWKYPYEKDDNWNFYLVVNWSRLEIPLNPEQLVKLHDLTLWVNDLTLWVINIYKKNKLSQDINHFEMDWFFWDKSIDVSKTWIIDDIEYISSEKLNDIFCKNDEILIQKYIDFLNKIVEVKKIEYKNKINEPQNIELEKEIYTDLKIFDNKKLDEIKDIINNSKDSNEKRKLSLIFLSNCIKDWYIVKSSEVLSIIKNFTPNNIVVNNLSNTIYYETKLNFKLDWNNIKIIDYNNMQIWNIDLYDYNDVMILRKIISK